MLRTKEEGLVVNCGDSPAIEESGKGGCDLEGGGAEGLEVDEGIDVKGTEAFVRSMRADGWRPRTVEDMEDDRRCIGGGFTSSEEEGQKEDVVEEETRFVAQPADPIPTSVDDSLAASA